MAPEHFLASSTYLTIYKQCIPAGMVDGINMLIWLLFRKHNCFPWSCL